MLQQNRGYTILEMVIAIAISSIVTAFSISAGLNALEYAKYERTSKEMSELAWAGSQYYIRNNIAAPSILAVKNDFYGTDITAANLYGSNYGLITNSKLTTVSAVLPTGIRAGSSFNTFSAGSNSSSVPITFGLANEVKSSTVTWYLQ